MRQLPTATGGGLAVSELRAKLERRPTALGAKIATTAAAVALVSWAAWLVVDLGASSLRLVGIVVGISAATFLLTRVFD